MLNSGYRRNSAQRGDALALLQSLLDCSTPLVFFDPQHRETLDRLAYGNEGARQKGRVLLPAMTSDYIDACCREAARVLRPSGYLLQWVDTFRLCEAYHLRIADVLKCVDLIAWDSALAMDTAHGGMATICWCCRDRRLPQRALGATAVFRAGGSKGRSQDSPTCETDRPYQSAHCCHHRARRPCRRSGSGQFRRNACSTPAWTQFLRL